MAERIVSPGVFTREKDLSFLPQGIANIGAAVVGPTTKGPAFRPTVVTSTSQYEQIFGAVGGTTPYYTGMAVSRYLSGGASSVTVVRVLGIGGYSVDAINLCIGDGTSNGKIMATLAPSRKASGGTGDLSLMKFGNPSGSFAVPGTATPGAQNKLYISGSGVTLETITNVNMNGGENALPTDGQTLQHNVYMYKNFNEDGALSDDATILSASLHTLNFQSGTQSFGSDGSFARTPWIQSQKGVGFKKLFRVYTRGHGEQMNTDFYIAFQNIKAAAVNNTSPDYAQFDMMVYKRRSDDPTKFDAVETFAGCNFDPQSKNFVVQMVGDGWSETNSLGEITKYGNYGNGSQFVRLGDYTSLISEASGIGRAVAPMGFTDIYNPVPGLSTACPVATYNTSVDTNGSFDPAKYYGWDFADSNKVNKQYLAPVPGTATTGANTTMSLEDNKGTAGGDVGFADADTLLTLSDANTNVRQRKFAVPFQWGFGGENPARNIYFNGDIAANNQQGFDCSSALASGSVAYKKALGSISDPDFIDMNLLSTPGIIHEYHPVVSNKAISIASTRGDTFYIMDGSRWGRSVSNAVADVKSLDNNYVATYFPWVSISNPGGGANIWVPPSVVMIGVFSQNDSIGQEWFAPAGLNRGGISANDVKKILTHTDRDELYDGRVNPIASFPQQGIVAFGQKTLQARPSALDRINVRRLLINLKKFIASSSRFLVFEQNNASTRNRFLNIVNPYMESVQQRSGLSAFRVVMDDTNNTPDVVDRNQLIGQIFIQPTRTAEFIVLDFVVLPTGAAFPE
jgi:hypothetical protein